MVDLDLVELNKWLSNYINFERKPETKMFRLDTMETLCAALGHPEKSCPCFHVTGSKGKGTICADIAGILREAGYTTGVLASPHVLHFTERVGTGEGPFSQNVYDTAFSELRETVEKLIANGKLEKELVSWFELTTTFTMLCFRAAKVDYAIYEVGMGGRLDATNVVDPVACAFGPIELEHTEILGDTLAKIATEKAGIIKGNIPCISAPQKKEAEKVLANVAKKHHAEITFIPNEGNYLDQDAKVAQLAVQKALPKISDEVCRKGILKVKLPGRFEKVACPFGDIPYILYDVAHTPESMRVLLGRMKEEGIKHATLIFGCAEGKDVSNMAEQIVQSKLFNEIFLTRPGDFKKCDFAGMTKAFDEATNKNAMATTLHSSKDYKALINSVIQKCSDDRKPLIVTGSFYLVGEVQKILVENY